ncbi:Uncharacterised protein [Mycobacteroides abscessus subsp. abscessus]|nr:Uncharacterised protein [Mycobacteroides abscessus subsp. abscessus]
MRSSSASASGSVTPPVASPLPGWALSSRTVDSRSSRRISSAFQSTLVSESETTYFFARSMTWAKGTIHSGLPSVISSFLATSRQPASIIS